MLAHFRKISDNILFKIVISFIVLSFVIWGIGDIIRKSPTDQVISINNKYSVSNVDFQRTKRNYINHIQTMLGTELTQEQIKDLNVNGFVVNYLIESKLFETLKKEFKLEMSDEIVINQIKLDQNFFDESKKFNKNLFNKMLENNYLSENQLGDIIKNEKSKEIIVDTLTVGNIYPKALVEIFSKYLGEKRDITMAYISKQDMKFSEPELKDLESLYQEKQELFTVPEFRKISYIEISPETVKENVKISDGEIKEEYKNYIAENYTIEKRYIYNLIVKEKEKAEEVLKLLKAGHDFIKAAEKYSSRSLDKLLMKGVVKSDLPAELQNEAFGLNKGEFSKIIATNYGYHIIKVNEIQKTPYPKYEVIREDLYKNLVNRKSEELIYEYIKDIEDLIASNPKEIKDLAKEFNITLKTLDFVNYDGNNVHGKKVDFPKSLNIQNIIFSKNLKELELIEDPSSSSYFLVSIDEIHPKTIKGFESVKPEIIKLWVENEKEAQAFKLTSQLKQKVKDENVSLSEAALSLGFTVESKSIYRIYNDDFAKSLPAEFLREILHLKKHSLSNAYNINGKYAISQLNEITFEKANTKANLEEAVKFIQSQYQESYFEDLIYYLKNTHNIVVNKDLLR